MAISIYTKTGDEGFTNLLGENKVLKVHERVEAYGNIDELNVCVGMLKDQYTQNKDVTHQLHWVQEKLFSLGSLLATSSKYKGEKFTEITENDTQQLEKWIDIFNFNLPELKNFILPGGHISVSYCHICRVVCRRAERSIVKLFQIEKSEANIIPFLNRLSDYFFILARQIGQELQIEETIWRG